MRTLSTAELDGTVIGVEPSTKAAANSPVAFRRRAWPKGAHAMETKQEKMRVAATILTQLGGQQCIMLTGSKHFVGGDNYLSFKVARNAHGWNHCKIELNGSDLYDVTFLRYRELEIRDKVAFEDIYAEQLQDIFEETTELYVTLHKR